MNKPCKNYRYIILKNQLLSDLGEGAGWKLGNRPLGGLIAVPFAAAAPNTTRQIRKEYDITPGKRINGRGCIFSPERFILSLERYHHGCARNGGRSGCRRTVGTGG
jgi:hypothetical protein